MRYSDALRTVNDAPLIKWPALPQIRLIAPELRALLPLEPVTFEHGFNGESVTLRGPLSDLPEPLATVTTINVDGTELQLWSETDLLQVLLELAGHIEDVTRYPSDAHVLILDHLARSLLDDLSHALSADMVTIIDHGPAGDFDSRSDCIPFSLSGTNLTPIRLVLSGSLEALKGVAALFSSKEDDAPPAKIQADDVTFSCTLLAPNFEVTEDDLSSVKEDDVMLLDAQWLEADTPLRLCVADTLMAKVSREEDTLLLSSEFETLKRTIPMTSPREAFANLPVTVSVELARKSLSLEELESVSIGDVLDFAEADLDTVALTANGREVAKGVLVRSGDQIGIRLTTLF